ncbi:D-alanyl-D-alanine carboxypeptidase family protein [Natranaerobius trueperi]|uniref:serine-type D-Ala-D-Ala carboxypeptidase n=1 Tax=Natranaerobius trueperi TaxID=759412 RepID=A0A226C0I7_9FIRM|nr:D-alanyl-D-alanine carboxypeptidase family protein [Natranaerobius trueperi]OWZ83969.1 D-alanyl-D-alanine carboxypeptidase [Natranaerobius trueperi]
MKNFNFFIIVIVILMCISPTHLFGNEEISQEDISAKSVSLMDVSSGRILYEHNSDEILPMASITKVMTALVALEEGDLEDKVTASESASNVEGSSIYLSKGETLTLEEMLYGLMLESGNDAAHAIAEYVSGSVPDFAQKMTDKAHKIGAKNSKFKNPHGLPAENHYTTAHDMTIIAKTALNNEKLAEIVSTNEYTIPWPANDDVKRRYLNNDNKLLDKLDISDGVKTGWTDEAGRCLIFSASVDGKQIVGTLLNASNMFQDAENLINYSFDNFKQKKLLQSGQLVRTVPVEGGRISNISLIASRDIVKPLKEEESESLSYNLKLPEQLKAPLDKHEVVGRIEIISQNDVIGEASLLTSRDVERSFFNRFFNLDW